MDVPYSAIRLYICRHLDCFQYFVIINNAAINNLDMYSFVLLEMYFQGKFLEVALLGQKVNAYADLLDIANSSL